MGKRPRRRVRRRRLVNLLGNLAFSGRFRDVLDTFLFECPPITVTRPQVVLPALQRRWDGVRIAHLTDLHHSRFTGLDFIRRAVQTSNDEKPDIVALTGDFVTSDAGICATMFDLLSDLKAPLGVYAVLGNHDHWSCPTTIRGLLRTSGIRVIDNSNVVLARGSHRLAIAGVGDLWSDVQDLRRALRRVPESATRVLLCHNPRYAKEMPASPRVDLMLAGHTHGFEFKLPFRRRRRPVTPRRRYAAGLIHAPHCQVYISTGLGSVGLPIRFNGRPELPVVTLRRA